MTNVGRALVPLAFVAAACSSKPKPQPQQAQRTIVWRTLGSWSGRGNRQTESFTSDTGTLRVRWEATALPGRASPSFSLEAHSAISGRLLQTVVDKGGPGSGTGYVQQDPHVFYMVVDADGVGWQFTVEEAIGYP
jgi:hypothetical protein